MKRLAILGSTGSIGRSALSVVDAHPDRPEVVSLAAGDNAALLSEQVARYCPEAVAMATSDGLDRLKSACTHVPRVVGCRRGHAERTGRVAEDDQLSRSSALVGFDRGQGNTRRKIFLWKEFPASRHCASQLTARKALRCGQVCGE